MTQSTLPIAMPEFAPFVAMAFLETGLLVFLGAVGSAIALAPSRRRIAAWVGAGASLGALGHVGRRG